MREFLADIAPALSIATLAEAVAVLGIIGVFYLAVTLAVGG